MRSITTWWRIEPQSDDLVPGPDRALQARVYDPAWLLGRQWQLGELTGEDAASPASVRMRLAAAPITRVQLGTAGGPVHELEPGELLEPIVEAEAGTDEDWAASAAAGAHFLEALRQANLPALADAFRAEYPLPDPDPAGQDLAAGRRYRILRRTSLDGFALRRAARGPDGQPRLPARPAVTGQAQRSALLGVLRRWLAWYPDAPAGSGTAWVPERLEYRFAVAAPDPTGDGEAVLEAPAYEGGRLDWDSLRAAPASRSLGAAGDPGRTRWAPSSLPTRVSYPGMPANRWWELEDGGVSYGHVEAEGGDLARLLMIEFASVYGNDWFLAPADIALGTVLAVEALIVGDTFGRETLVAPAAAPGFSMFSVSGAAAGVLVLPPVLGPSLEGPPIEEVQLARDEAANMAWAIERVVAGVAGNRIDRYEAWRDRIAVSTVGGAAGGASDPGPETLAYTLATDPPDHWIPLVPRSDGHRSIRLHRGEVLHGDGQTFPPLGHLLEPGRPLALFEEELPRSGLLATRAWQFARTAAGGSVAWIGRRTRPGRGESRSGLAYDRLSTPEGPEGTP
jgi:hypothetical protein